jgi:hypothetical protein
MLKVWALLRWAAISGAAFAVFIADVVNNGVIGGS